MGLWSVAQISATTVHAYSIKMCYIKRFHLDLRYPSKLKILNTLPMYLGLWSFSFCAFAVERADFFLRESNVLVCSELSKLYESLSIASFH